MTALEKLQASGIRREGSMKKGFSYRTASGGAVAKSEVERIRALKLPPAWTDVFISPNAKAKLQAIGKDKAGRWQYRYHPSFVERQQRRKYERIMLFAEALPRMRAAIERGLARPKLDREKVLACILEILATCFIRPGSEDYAAENGSFGLATLKNEHVKVTGDLVVFEFRGKAGKIQHRELRDARVAKVVSKLSKLPGELFKYYDDTGALVDVKRRTINAYIKDVMGEEFTAKDFRTWAGTLVCACALARRAAEIVPGESKKRHVSAAVKETASALGNTPAVCRSSYIYPSVLSSFEKGKVVEKYFETVEELVARRRPGLHAAEKSLLELLREDLAVSPRKPTARAKRVARKFSPTHRRLQHVLADAMAT